MRHHQEGIIQIVQISKCPLRAATLEKDPNSRAQLPWGLAIVASRITPREADQVCSEAIRCILKEHESENPLLAGLLCQLLSQIDPWTARGIARELVRL